MRPTSVRLPVPPLIGRDEELALVLELLRRDACGGVVLAGPAGVGKTRLANDAAAHMGAEGFALESIVATRAAHALPFGAMLRLVATEDLEPGAGPVSLYRAVRQSLETRSSEGVVVVVDDAHLLDDASAEVLSQVAQSRRVRSLFTIRAGAPVPDSVTRLWRDEALVRIEVQPLAEPDVGRVAAALLGGRVEAATISRLFDVTSGNVLFLREVLIDALATGGLSDVGGTWVWRPRGRLGTRLADVVRERLGLLDDSVWDVLGVLSIGEPLSLSDAAVLEPVLSPSALDEAERAGCVRIAHDGRRREVRLAHPLYGEFARSRMTRSAADRVRVELAARLGAAGCRRRGDVLRRALWLLEAGVRDDAEMFVAASIQARAVDAQLSLRLATAAVEADPGFDSRLALAWVHPDPGQREALIDELSAVAEGDDQIVRATDLLVTFRLFARLDFVGAGDALADAAGRVAYQATRCSLNARRVQVLLASGSTAHGIELARAILDDPAALPGARLRAAGQRAFALTSGGHSSAATAVITAEHDLALATADAEPILSAEVLAASVVCPLFAGRFGEAETATEELRALATSGPNAFARGWLLLLSGRIALFRGQASLATELLSDAVIAHREHPNGPLLWWTQALLVEAHALVGHAAEAHAVVSELGWLGEFDYGMPACDATRALAWGRVASGELSGATAMFLQAADRARSRELTVLELLAVYDAVRVGSRGPLLDRLIDCASRCEGSLAGAIGAHGSALRDGDGHQLMAASIGLADVGLGLCAAEAAAHAAQAFAGEALRRREQEAIARVQSLRSGLVDVHTPVLDAVAVAVPLSRREREVAGLAARGMSSRAIADRLGVSVRTVDGHLYQAFSKLGVNSRADLADAIGIPENR